MTQAKSISHYLIEREIGRGGMGVVYQGLDTRLNRAVAIKSLPPQFASDHRWRARFETEARTLAAVNHPNLAAIYGIESDDTGAYLILELAEGPTLDEQLRAKPPEVREALEICQQVAVGIAAAHQQNIIHRDLKPSNIKLRHDGVIKVLDFGIAKSAHSEGPVDPSQATAIAPPANSAGTLPGFMLGTPGYMSPEQARGHPVNPATDLWALGCILYECLAHRMAFPGETLADTIAVTLLGQPDMGALPPRTPGRVLKLLQICLTKDHRQRSHTMSQAAAVLQDALNEVSSSFVVIRATTSGGDDAYDREPGNLPPFDDRLIGRTGTVQKGAGALNEARLVTLIGPPGMGATRLAACVSQSRRAGYRGGIWWNPLPSTSDASLPAATTALILKTAGRGGGIGQSLRDRIADRSMLLVLDGCQYSPSACAALAMDLLRTCPNLQVIATARSPLGTSGECTIDVPPLAAPDLAHLFIERGQAIAPGFSPTLESLDAGLLKWLRGIPLAAELAAPLAASLPLDTFETQLQLRASLNDGAAPGSLAPEKLCRMLAAWAMDLLPPAGLAMLLRACVFVGPWSIRAASAAGGAKESMPEAHGDDPAGSPHTTQESRVADQVSKLVARSLIQNIPGPDSPARPCYTLPSIVRAEAMARLKENPAAQAMVIGGYRNYLIALADHAASRLDGPASEGFAVRLEREYADLAIVAQAAPTDAGAARVRGLLARLLALRGLG